MQQINDKIKVLAEKIINSLFRHSLRVLGVVIKSRPHENQIYFKDILN